MSDSGVASPEILRKSDGAARIGRGGSTVDADLTALETEKADLASPAFTGVPTAPTAALGTATNQIATTDFTAQAIAALADSAPGTLDTLNELAAALGDDPNFATTVTNSIATKMPLSGGDFTGPVHFSNNVPLRWYLAGGGAAAVINVLGTDNIYFGSTTFFQNVYFDVASGKTGYFRVGGTDVVIDYTSAGVRFGTAGARIQRFDADSSLAADSDVRVATQKATKAYVDSNTTKMPTAEAEGGTATTKRSIDSATLKAAIDAHAPAAVASGAVFHVATITASADNSLEFSAFSATYDAYLFLLRDGQRQDSSSNAALLMEVSEAASWKTGASDYRWSMVSNGTGSSDTTASNMTLSGNHIPGNLGGADDRLRGSILLTGWKSGERLGVEGKCFGIGNINDFMAQRNGTAEADKVRLSAGGVANTFDMVVEVFGIKAS